MSSQQLEHTTISDTTTCRHRAKYANKNLIHRLSLNYFFDTFARLLEPLSYKSVLDFGCGEGFCLQELANRGVYKPTTEWTGVDLRDDAIGHARSQFPTQEFLCLDIFDPQLDGRQFDLTICSQVLEHLPNPEIYVKRLVNLSTNHLVFSVPNEPWFRIMNFLRGRDIRRFGNHPEHINHWSAKKLRRFLEPFVDVIEFRCPFPFLIAVCEKRQGN